MDELLEEILESGMNTPTGLFVHNILKKVAKNDEEKFIVLQIATRVALEEDPDANLVGDIAKLVRRNPVVRSTKA